MGYCHYKDAGVRVLDAATSNLLIFNGLCGRFGVKFDNLTVYDRVDMQAKFSRQAGKTGLGLA